MIGMVFHHVNLISAKIVWQNVALPLKIAGLGTDEIQSRIDDALSLIGSTYKASHYPSELSGGHKQRVGIARVLWYINLRSYCAMRQPQHLTLKALQRS